MRLDDKICYCYNVPLRKLIQFARRTRPSRASQMSECLGAGTGCGWCIPILTKIHASVMTASPLRLDIEPADYARGRDAYRADPQHRHRWQEDANVPAEPASGGLADADGPLDADEPWDADGPPDAEPDGTAG